MTQKRTQAICRFIPILCCLGFAAVVPGTVHGANVPLWSVTSVLFGQKTLLDMEEEPPSKQPLPKTNSSPAGTPSSAETKRPSANTSEEEPPTSKSAPESSLPPGSLDDLIADGQTEAAPSSNEKFEVEEVCDLLIQKLQTTPIRVRLLPERLEPPLPAVKIYEFVRLTGSATQQETRKRDWKLAIRGDEVYDILYYEDRMLERAMATFGLSRAELVDPVIPISLSNPEWQRRARVTISILIVALTEHESARSRLQRRGTTWDSIQNELSRALFNLQLAQVELIVSRGNMQNSIAALDRMRTSPAIGTTARDLIRSRFEKLLLDPAAQSLKAADHFAARTALDEFLSRYPFDRGDKSRKIREGLIAAAKGLVERARKEKDPSWLEQAKNVWPPLGGLDDVRRQMIQDYPILNCAYTTLPKHFSPLTAVTTVDRHATSLLFESLVEWKLDEQSVAHYATMLATHRPVPQARGREFTLPRAQWSDSGDKEPHYCTAEDVRWTIELLRKFKPMAYPLAWQDLIEQVHSSDPFLVDIRLQRDYWQPLSLMDFPILPRSRFPTCGEKKPNWRPSTRRRWGRDRTGRSGRLRRIQ